MAACLPHSSTHVIRASGALSSTTSGMSFTIGLKTYEHVEGCSSPPSEDILVRETPGLHEPHPIKDMTLSDGLEARK